MERRRKRIENKERMSLREKEFKRKGLRNVKKVRRRGENGEEGISDKTGSGRLLTGYVPRIV